MGNWGKFKANLGYIERLFQRRKKEFSNEVNITTNNKKHQAQENSSKYIHIDNLYRTRWLSVVILAQRNLRQEEPNFKTRLYNKYEARGH